MLTDLLVKNFAVIEEVRLEFADKVNIVSGETGAGKSVFVGSIKALLGERIGKEYIRNKDEKAVIEGIFSVSEHLFNDEVKEKFEINDQLIIRREFDVNGKNKIFVNGYACTLSELANIGEVIADIHGQHEHQLLMNSKNHINYIDAMVDRYVLDEYASKYKKYKDALQKYNQLKEQLQEMQKQADYNKFQFNEIEELKLTSEDNELEKQITYLASVEKIRTAIVLATDKLSDGDNSIIDSLGEVSHQVDTLAHISNTFLQMKEQLDNIFINTQSLTDSMKSELKSLHDVSESDIDTLNERWFKIKGLLKKYSLVGVTQLIEKKNELSKLVYGFDEFNSELEELKPEVERLLKAATDSAGKLNSAREAVAVKLFEKIETILKDLELPNVKLSMNIHKKNELDIHGGVSVEFYIKVNKGFDPVPLSKFASGGEISRIMLAFKEVFANIDRIGTLIFDEIDTGISGLAAKKVADKLYQLGRTQQIIVITHLPVVAGIGSKHFYVEKINDTPDGLTQTVIRELEESEREKVIAVMISGVANTESVNQAKSLIRN